MIVKPMLRGIFLMVLIALIGTTSLLAQHGNNPPVLAAAQPLKGLARSDSVAEKSTSRAALKHIFYSLLLPGSGQLAAGKSTRGKVFLGVDLALWVGYFGSLAYADKIGQDYRAFAALHAGVYAPGKTEQYWIDIGYYDNIYRFNESRLLNRDIAGMYPETPEYYWQWDAEGNRLKYNDLRLDELNWKRRATFLISGLILNRIVSAVDMLRIFRKEKREQEARSSLLYFDYHYTRLEGETFRLNLRWFW